MKHRTSCRRAALITAATGTVLVTSAFGIMPAMAATASTVAPSTTSSAAPANAAPAAPEAVSSAPSTAATTSAPTAPAASTPAAPAAAPASAPAASADATSAESVAPAATPEPVATQTPAAAPAATSTPAPSATAAKPSRGDHGGHHDVEQMPTYPAGSSQSAPVALPGVRAGESFTADLRAQNAKGATYTLTTVEGGSVSLPDGLTFSGGVLSGTPTFAGTFTALVTATNDCGSASEWVRMTVSPAATLQLGVVVHSVPAASDGSYTWVASDGSTNPGPITVQQGGSITLVPWTSDEYGNPTNATDRAEVWSDVDGDVVTKSGAGFTITFPSASPHVITVTVDGVCTEFTVQVNAATTTEPTTPTTPVDPATPTVPVDVPTVATPSPAVPTAVRLTTTTSSALTPTATATPVASADELAYTGADTSTPLGWAAGLLAAGAALLGIRLVSRRQRG